MPAGGDSTSSLSSYPRTDGQLDSKAEIYLVPAAYLGNAFLASHVV